MFNESKFSNKGGAFRLAPSQGISDLTLMGVATEYKTAVSRKYQTLPQRLIAQTFNNSPDVFASIKYDGEQVFVFFDSEKDICCAFNAPSGRCRIGLGCLKDLAGKLKKHGVKKALLVAEIYLKSTQRSQVSDVIRCTFNGTDEERDALSLGIYDIIMLDGKNFRANQNNFKVNLDKLTELIGTDQKDSAHVVEGNIIKGNKVQEYFTEITATRGMEGIVVRSLNAANIYKIKPQITVDAVVIGYVEGDFEGQYGVTSLLCGLYNKETNHIQALTRVGSGFKDELRVTLLDTLSGLKVPSPVSMTDSDGRPITFIKPQMVIQVEGENLVYESLSGKVPTTQLFSWNGKEYQFEGIKPAPILTHATFACFRDDKQWDDGGTRMEQVFSQSHIKALTEPESGAGKPEIVDRQVFTKTTKGLTAVRKLLIIKTNNPSKYPFVVHWTDFSAGRKTPLETNVSVATTVERAQKLAADIIANEIKKGWEKHK